MHFKSITSTPNGLATWVFLLYLRSNTIDSCDILRSSVLEIHGKVWQALKVEVNNESCHPSGIILLRNHCKFLIQYGQLSFCYRKTQCGIPAFMSCSGMVEIYFTALMLFQGCIKNLLCGCTAKYCKSNDRHKASTERKTNLNVFSTNTNSCTEQEVV